MYTCVYTALHIVYTVQDGFLLLALTDIRGCGHSGFGHSGLGVGGFGHSGFWTFGVSFKFWTFGVFGRSGFLDVRG